jgi:hypothetical protein
MKHIALASLFTAMLASTPTLASEIGTQESYEYVGIGVGSTRLAANQQNLPGVTAGASLSSNSSNFNIFVGKQFDSFLGMEIGYQSGAAITAREAGATREVMKADFMTIAATMGTPFNERIGMYGKLGGAFWKYAFSNGNYSKQGFAPSVGLGMNVNLYGGTSRQLRLEYNYYRLENVYLKSAGVLSVNALFVLP